MGLIYEYQPQNLFYEINDKIPLSRYKLVLFDIGGVLINYDKVFNTASKEQDIPIEYINNTFDKYDEEITRGKITPQEMYLQVLKENKISKDNKYNFVDSWVRDYEKIPQTYDSILKISNNFQVGILSNIYTGIFELLIQKDLVPNIKYKNIFLSCDLGFRKPEVEIFKHVENTSNLKSEEILLIDDQEDNLAQAKERGWGTFLFDRLNPEASNENIQKILGVE